MKKLRTKQTTDNNNTVTELNNSSFQSSQYRNTTSDNYVAYVRHKHRLNINPNKPLFCYVPNNLPDKGEWQLYVPVPGLPTNCTKLFVIIYKYSSTYKKGSEPIINSSESFLILFWKNVGVIVHCPGSWISDKLLAECRL